MEGSYHVKWNSIIYRKEVVHKTETERSFLLIYYIFYCYIMLLLVTCKSAPLRTRLPACMGRAPKMLLRARNLLTYDLRTFLCSCTTWSIYFDIFAVWQSTELTTGLPGFRYLWIFGSILNFVFGFEPFRSLAVFLSKRHNAFSSLLQVLTLVLCSSAVSFRSFFAKCDVV